MEAAGDSHSEDVKILHDGLTSKGVLRRAKGDRGRMYGVEVVPACNAVANRKQFAARSMSRSKSRLGNFTQKSLTRLQRSKTAVEGIYQTKSTKQAPAERFLRTHEKDIIRRDYYELLLMVFLCILDKFIQAYFVHSSWVYSDAFFRVVDLVFTVLDLIVLLFLLFKAQYVIFFDRGILRNGCHPISGRDRGEAVMQSNEKGILKTVPLRFEILIAQIDKMTTLLIPMTLSLVFVDFKGLLFSVNRLYGSFWILSKEDAKQDVRTCLASMVLSEGNNRPVDCISMPIAFAFLSILIHLWLLVFKLSFIRGFISRTGDKCAYQKKLNLFKERYLSELDFVKNADISSKAITKVVRLRKFLEKSKNKLLLALDDLALLGRFSTGEERITEVVLGLHSWSMINDGRDLKTFRKLMRYRVFDTQYMMPLPFGKYIDNIDVDLEHSAWLQYVRFSSTVSLEKIFAKVEEDYIIDLGCKIFERQRIILRGFMNACKLYLNPVILVDGQFTIEKSSESLKKLTKAFAEVAKILAQFPVKPTLIIWHPSTSVEEACKEVGISNAVIMVKEIEEIEKLIGRSFLPFQITGVDTGEGDIWCKPCIPGWQLAASGLLSLDNSILKYFPTVSVTERLATTAAHQFLCSFLSHYVFEHQETFLPSPMILVSVHERLLNATGVDSWVANCGFVCTLLRESNLCKDPKKVFYLKEIEILRDIRRFDNDVCEVVQEQLRRFLARSKQPNFEEQIHEIHENEAFILSDLTGWSKLSKKSPVNPFLAADPDHLCLISLLYTAKYSVELDVNLFLDRIYFVIEYIAVVLDYLSMKRGELYKVQVIVELSGTRELVRFKDFVKSMEKLNQVFPMLFKPEIVGLYNEKTIDKGTMANIKEMDIYQNQRLILVCLENKKDLERLESVVCRKLLPRRLGGTSSSKVKKSSTGSSDANSKPESLSQIVKQDHPDAKTLRRSLDSSSRPKKRNRDNLKVKK